MRSEISALNFTNRWERDYYKEKPSNHDFNVLVTNCLEQLHEEGQCYCFYDEQKDAIIKGFEGKLTAEVQDGIIALRREKQ